MRIISQNGDISLPAERFAISVLRSEDAAEIIAYDSSERRDYITLGHYRNAEQAEYEFNRINTDFVNGEKAFLLSEDKEDKEDEYRCDS